MASGALQRSDAKATGSGNETPLCRIANSGRRRIAGRDRPFLQGTADNGVVGDYLVSAGSSGISADGQHDPLSQFQGTSIPQTWIASRARFHSSADCFDIFL